MKTKTSITLSVINISIFVFNFTSFSQSPDNINYYQNHKGISKAAKDFYAGKFKASDDTKSLSILDSLYTKNNSTRPFYIYLACRMMEKSDGALSEELSYHAKRISESHPDWVIEFLFSNKALSESRFIDLWAKAISQEIKIDCENQENRCLVEWYNNAKSKTSKINFANLKSLYTKVSACLINEK